MPGRISRPGCPQQAVCNLGALSLPPPAANRRRCGQQRGLPGSGRCCCGRRGEQRCARVNDLHRAAGGHCRLCHLVPRGYLAPAAQAEVLDLGARPAQREADLVAVAGAHVLSEVRPLHNRPQLAVPGKVKVPGGEDPDPVERRVIHSAGAVRCPRLGEDLDLIECHVAARGAGIAGPYAHGQAMAGAIVDLHVLDFVRRVLVLAAAVVKREAGVGRIRWGERPRWGAEVLWRRW